MMEVELKKKWVDALRSGRYNQGTGRLVSKFHEATGVRYEHCVLGVLMDVAGWDEEGAYDKLDSVLGGARVTNDLSHRNDADGWKFPELADWIEVNL